MNTPNTESEPRSANPFAQKFFHGTKADLKIGDFIRVGFSSNYGENKEAKHIYLSSTLNAAIWGLGLLWAKVAKGFTW